MGVKNVLVEKIRNFRGKKRGNVRDVLCRCNDGQISPGSPLSDATKIYHLPMPEYAVKIGWTISDRSKRR